MPDFDDILREAKRQGFRVDRTRPHLVLWPPKRKYPPVFCSRSPSDRRAVHNLIRDLRHSGFRVRR